MRRSRAESTRITLRLPEELRLESERLARLAGCLAVSDYLRAAIREKNARERERERERERPPVAAGGRPG